MTHDVHLIGYGRWPDRQTDQCLRSLHIKSGLCAGRFSPAAGCHQQLQPNHPYGALPKSFPLANPNCIAGDSFSNFSYWARSHSLYRSLKMLEITVLSLFLAYVSLGLALVSRPDFAANIDHARTFQSAPIEKRDSVPAGYVAAPYYPTPKGGWISSVRILRS
jgi:hypothetical protein